MKKIFDLQLFADAAGDSAGNADNAATETNTAPDTGKDAATTESKPKTAAEPKYTDADVDEMINKKFAEWQKKQQKAVDEAKKLERMDAQQKAEYERDQLQKELDEYKRKDAIAEMTKTARKMLADRNINVSDEVIAVLVSTDAEKTKAAIDGFSKAYTADVEAAVKDRLRGEPPKRGTSDAGQTISEIDKRIAKYQ